MGETDGPDPTHPRQTESGSPSSPGPGTSPLGSRRTCLQSSLTIPTTIVWEVQRAAWSQVGRFDRLTLELAPEGQPSDGPARVTVEYVPPDEVAERYGVDEPTTDVAIVVALRDGPRLAGEMHGTRASGALRTIDIVQDLSGAPLAVLGVDGEGCYRLSVTGWDATDATAEAQLVLEIRRP